MVNLTTIADKYVGTPYAMPVGTDLTEDIRHWILAVNIIGLVGSIVAIALRLWARKLTLAGFALDDYLMIPSLGAAIIFFCFNVFYMVPRGLGRHIWVTGDVPRAIRDFSFGLWMLELCYTSIIAFVKFSLLAFYYRIFKVPAIKIPLFTLLGVVTCWAIALWLTTIFQCVPVQGFWDKSIESECNVDVADFFLGNSIPNIITDVAIMILPVPFIMKLQLRSGQKIALAGVFALGTFVAVISATRLKYIMTLDLTDVDIMWNFNDTEIWSSLECYIAIICCCLPSIRPVLALFFTKAMQSRSRNKASFNMTGNLSTKPHTKVSGNWNVLKGDSSVRGGPVVSTKSASDEEQLVEGHGIRVEHTFRVAKS